MKPPGKICELIQRQVVLSQNNYWARLLGSQTLRAVSRLGAGTACWHCFLLVGHSLLHSRMLDVVLSSLENSQKHRMPCRNKGDLMHLWLWQDFHRTYLWSSCRLESAPPVTAVGAVRRKEQGLTSICVCLSPDEHEGGDFCSLSYTPALE